MHAIAPMLGLFFLLPFGLVSLLLFVFWIWMLIDAIQNPRLVGTEKIVWVLVIILLPFIGSLIYFFAGRSRS
jgi:hypothetical protein